MRSQRNASLRRIEGPIYPILSAFKEDGALDCDAVAKYVDMLASVGVPAVMTTVGTSRFNLLTDDEIRKMNETVARAAKGRCFVILAGPQQGSTKLNAAFARHAEDVGADAFIGFYP
ncbi:MAG TPA: dihydrodipicolinate synthase family protein, partial [Lacipirellulaceae bacterium]|nr:dihydrodipicolinate synthase family protein [Lacipirellulaceae bacterium]